MRKLHQILGLVLGIPLFIIGFTGSLFTWQPELTKWYYEDLYVEQSSSLNLTHEEVAQKLQKEKQSEIRTFYFPERERETYIIQFYDDTEFYFVNPSDGEILGHMSSRRGIFDILLKVHMSFFVEGGKYFVGWVALMCSFFVLISGLYLWFPKRRKFRKRDFWNWVSKSSNGFNIHWHKFFGLYFAPILFVLGISGAFFTFKSQYTNFLHFLFQEESEKPLLISSNYQEGENPMDIFEALAIMNSHFTTYYPRSIHLTKEKSKTAYFSWIKTYKGVDAGKRVRPYMYVDIYSKNFIYVFNPNRANTIDTIINKWIPPIHFGELGGMIHRIINSLTGMGLCFIIYFGFAFNRQKKK